MYLQIRGPLQPVLEDMVWEVARSVPGTGAKVLVRDQTQFQNPQHYPRPETTNDILFNVAIGGSWVHKREIHARDQNGEQRTLFWIMRCRNFVSKTPGVASHYITVQKVLSRMYHFRNSMLDQHFTVQDKSMRSCWLFQFYHSEPTPIGRARTTENEEDSSLEGASVVRLDPG